MTIYNLAASADDAQEAGGSMTLNGNTIAITATTRYGGFSFDTTAVPIAQAAPLAQVLLEHTVVGTAQVQLTWKGHKVTNSAQFAGGANNISNRYSSAATTAAFTDSAASVAGGTRRSIDVTAIVQELVNQAGWSSTSRITLVCKGETGADVTIRAWDFGSNAASLIVTLSTGGAMPKTAGVRLGTKIGGLLCSI